jgi:hypothetical protein
MEILKFENAPQKRTRQKSSTKGLLAIAGFAAVAVLGSTLAASITINSGSTLEFGQGIATTAACDTVGGIQMIPRATFVNAAGTAGVFSLSTVSFTGVDTTCLNDVFTLQAYGDTAATPLVLATAATGATTYDQATFVWSTTGTTSPRIATANWNLAAGTLDIGFLGTRATSGAVAKLTLQTSN